MSSIGPGITRQSAELAAWQSAAEARRQKAEAADRRLGLLVDGVLLTAIASALPAPLLVGTLPSTDALGWLALALSVTPALFSVTLWWRTRQAAQSGEVGAKGLTTLLAFATALFALAAAAFAYRAELPVPFYWYLAGSLWLGSALLWLRLWADDWIKGRRHARSRAKQAAWAAEEAARAAEEANPELKARRKRRERLRSQIIFSVLFLGLSAWLISVAFSPGTSLGERLLLGTIAALLPLHLFFFHLDGSRLVDRLPKHPPLVLLTSIAALAASPMVLYPLGALALFVAFVSGGSASPALAVTGLLLLSPILLIIGIALMFIASGYKGG